jgi:hypothetical protein
MARYRIEGQIVEADSPEAAYAQLDAMEQRQQLQQEYEKRGTGQKFIQGAVDPFRELYYGGKQLLGGELSEEDVADVERLRARQATGGLAGLGGEIASWALPFTMAGRAGAKLGQAATRGALPRTSAIGGAAAGEGALEAGYQAARPQLEDDPSRAERAGEGFLRGAAGGAIGRGAEEAVPAIAKFMSRPARTSDEALELEQLARQMGVDMKLTPGQAIDPNSGVFGSVVRGTEQAIDRMAGASPLLRAQQEAMERWNLAEIRRALPKDMREQISEAGPTGFKQLEDAFGDAYGEFEGFPLYRGNYDTGRAIDDMTRRSALQTPGLTNESRQTVLDVIDSELSRLPKSGQTVDSKWLLNVRSKLREHARQALDPAVRRAYKNAANRITETIESQLPKDVAKRLKKIDSAYRDTRPMVESGAMKGAMRQGFFTPEQLMSGGQKQVRGASAKASARNQATRRAREADKVFGTTIPRVGPGTAERLAAQALIGGGIGGTASLMGEGGFDPGTAAYGAVGSVLAGQALPRSTRLLTGRQGWQRGLRNRLPAIRDKSRLALPLATGYIPATREEQ